MLLNVHWHVELNGRLPLKRYNCNIGLFCQRLGVHSSSGDRVSPRDGSIVCGRWYHFDSPLLLNCMHSYQDGGPCALQGKGRWTECKRGKERKKWGKGEGQEQLKPAEKRGWMCSLFPVDLAYHSLIKMCWIIRKSCAHYHIRSR